jgi:hypothetical protein
MYTPPKVRGGMNKKSNKYHISPLYLFAIYEKIYTFVAVITLLT